MRTHILLILIVIIIFLTGCSREKASVEVQPAGIPQDEGAPSVPAAQAEETGPQAASEPSAAIGEKTEEEAGFSEEEVQGELDRRAKLWEDAQEYSYTLFEGDSAPGFTLKGLDGKKHSLKDYEGEEVVIIFWREACQICSRYLKEQQEYYSSNPEKNIVLAINTNGDFIEMRRAAQRLNITYTMLADEKEMVRSLYGVMDIYPVTYYINGDGKIDQLKIGAKTDPGTVGLRNYGEIIPYSQQVR